MFPPNVIRCVPLSEAWSAMMSVGARDVGGLGTAGIVEARFEDDILRVACFDLLKSKLNLLAVMLK